MIRKHILLLVLLLALGATQVLAQDVQAVQPWENGYHPQVLYGNDPALANNIVLQIDDNVYEENIRWVFETLQAQGITATYFPHTLYMMHQDPELWRKLVAAGNEIGYNTRNHEAGFTSEEFAEDFRLFQEEVRQVLGDPNYRIRYAKPPCWQWEENWFTWLESTDLIGVHTNIIGPAPSIPYVQGVISDTTDGGHIMSIISFIDQIEWLEENIIALQTLRDPNGQPYRITSVSGALGD